MNCLLSRFGLSKMSLLRNGSLGCEIIWDKVRHYTRSSHFHNMHHLKYRSVNNDCESQIFWMWDLRLVLMWITNSVTDKKIFMVKKNVLVTVTIANNSTKLGLSLLRLIIQVETTSIIIILHEYYNLLFWESYLRFWEVITISTFSDWVCMYNS